MVFPAGSLDVVVQYTFLVVANAVGSPLEVPSITSSISCFLGISLV